MVLGLGFVCRVVIVEISSTFNSDFLGSFPVRSCSSRLDFGFWLFGIFGIFGSGSGFLFLGLFLSGFLKFSKYFRTLKIFSLLYWPSVLLTGFWVIADWLSCVLTGFFVLSAVFDVRVICDYGTTAVALLLWGSCD